MQLPESPQLMSSRSTAGISRAYWHVIRQIDRLFTIYASRCIPILMSLGLLGGILTILFVSPEREIGGTSSWWPLVQQVALGNGYQSCQTNYFPLCNAENQLTASREPAPVLLFALVAWIFGPSLYASALLELALFLGILFGVYTLGRQLDSSKLGLVAAFGWLVYIPAYRQIPQVSGDLLATLALTWAMVALVKAKQQHQLRLWALAGVLLGIGALSRSVVLLIAAGLILTLMPWRHLTTLLHLRRLLPLVMLACTMGITIAPWVIRNYITFGSPIVGTTLSGYNLFRHNQPIEHGPFFGYVNPEQAGQAVQALMQRHTFNTGNISEAEMNTIYQQEAQRIIAAHPDRYLLLSLYRIIPLWSNYGVNEAYGDNLQPLDVIMAIQQLVLLVLGIIGIYLARPYRWLLGLPIIILTLAHMAVVARMRFVLVIIPLLLIGVAWVIKSCTRHYLEEK